MGIITISRGSYCRGKEIAEKLAESLGYACVSREILLEASEHFNIPEVKLVRAIHDSPSVFERFRYGKQQYISYIKEEFLSHLQSDNIVYHGLAGHFLIQGIPNVLKVRIIADLPMRVQEEMKRKQISEKEARSILVKDDSERQKWSMHLYGLDPNNASLYDVVLHIDNLCVDDAVDILTDIARRDCFQSTESSKKILREHYIAAKARSIILKDFPSVNIQCKNDTLFVSVDLDITKESYAQNVIHKRLKDFKDVKEIRVSVMPLGYS